MCFAKRERMILHLASRAVPNEVVPFLVANRLIPGKIALDFA